MKDDRSIATGRSHQPVICVDMGTTNTRAWLVAESTVVSRKEAAVGVRDSARSGTTAVVISALHDLCHVLEAEARAQALTPAAVLGAGMITSSLGLHEVDHVLAPAGKNELAGSMQRIF